MESQISSNDLSKGKMLEKYVADNLRLFFPNYKLIGRNERIANSTFDIHAKAPNGTDYFIEVKASKCNRLSIGQMVEYKASLSKVKPDAKIILICKGVNPSLKETLKKIDINVETFADLGLSLNIPTYEFQKNADLKLSPVEQNAYFALLKKGVVVAKAEDVKSTLNVSCPWAKNILSKLESHGAAKRIGRGKYVVIPADVLYHRKSYFADPLILVSELMRGLNYYIAYLSASHVHGITEQMPFNTTVAVLKQLRPISIGNVHISFVKLKESKFFGFNEIRYSDSFLNVSDIEKTVVDCIDRQELCGGIAEVIRTASNAVEAKALDWQKLIQYVRKYENQALAQRIGFIIELLTEHKKIQMDQRLLDDLSSLTSSKIYPLDVKAPKQGKISKKWGIINNAGQLEI